METQKNGNLVLHLKENDFVTVGDNVFLKISKIGEAHVKLVFNAPKEVRINRHHAKKSTKSLPQKS